MVLPKVILGTRERERGMLGFKRGSRIFSLTFESKEIGLQEERWEGYLLGFKIRSMRALF